MRDAFVLECLNSVVAIEDDGECEAHEGHQGHEGHEGLQGHDGHEGHEDHEDKEDRDHHDAASVKFACGTIRKVNTNMNLLRLPNNKKSYINVHMIRPPTTQTPIQL